MTLSELVIRLLDVRPSGKRRLIAIAGAPASGKSTLAEALASAFQDAGHAAQVVPMDGFHLDNRLLDLAGTRARKGAPHTFDAAGFVALIQRLRSQDTLYYPVFERDRDISIAGAGHIDSSCKTVVIEGNYLLLDAPVWRDLGPLWDFSLFLDIPEAELERRLLARWHQHGLSDSAARQKAETNDLPNARLVQRNSLAADLKLGPAEIDPFE